MKKLIVLSLVTFCVSLSIMPCRGQDLSHPGSNQPAINQSIKDTSEIQRIFISINGGLSVPLENYGTSTNAYLNSREIQGFAKPGSDFQISCGVFVTRKIAIIAKMGLDMNSIDNSQTGFQYDGGFKIWQYMGGFYYATSLSKSSILRNSYIWAQAMAGYVMANYPAEVKEYTGGKYSYSFDNGTAFGISFGTGFEKRIGKTLGFVVSLNYTSAEINYPGYSFHYAGITTTDYSHTYMYFGNMQVAGGISLHI